jgi:hypothetical protein
VIARHGKRVDHLLLQAFACGANVEQAGRKAGVSQRTVYRRRADPAFQEELRKLRAETLERTAAMLAASSLEAAKTALALLQADGPAQVRLGAVRTILEMSLHFRQNLELEERVRDLEAYRRVDRPRK